LWLQPLKKPGAKAGYRFRILFRNPFRILSCISLCRSNTLHSKGLNMSYQTAVETVWKLNKKFDATIQLERAGNAYSLSLYAEGLKDRWYPVSRQSLLEVEDFLNHHYLHLKEESRGKVRKQARKVAR
jgi:hypothetical protein